MSSLTLNLQLNPDDDRNGPPGEYSGRKAFKILQEYLQPDGDIRMNEAALQISAMLPGKTEYYTRGGDVGVFGSLVIDIAEQIPYQHSSQVKFVRLLHRLACSTKLNAVLHDEGYTFYENLGSVRELLLELVPPCFEPSDPPESLAKYVNFSAFLARLTGSGFFEDQISGILTMKDGLEEEKKDAEVRNCLVSAAAMRILFSGQDLFVEAVQTPSARLLEFRGLEPGPLFTGPSFGMERWKFWKRAFSAAAESGTSDECKGLASRAADMMDAVERNMSW